MNRLLCVLAFVLGCQVPKNQQNEKSSDVMHPAEVPNARQVAAAKNAFRQVQVSNKAIDGVLYGNYGFGSGVIRNQGELEAFVGTLQSGKRMYSAPNLQSALRDLAIDFEREVLLLLRHTDADTITRRFGTPFVTRSRILETGLSRSILHLTLIDPEAGVLRQVGQARAPHCFPVVVDTTLMDMAVLEVDGNIVFAVDFDGASPRFETL